MEETKICAACEIEQSIDEFWGDSSLEGGHNRRCRTCVRARILIPIERRINKFTEETRKANLKDEYDTLYLFLERIGYDLTKDIHQQFLDRHNQKLKVPMKYQKKRKSDMPAFFPDGTYNEEYKHRNKYLREL
jgi:hypothetical protein